MKKLEKDLHFMNLAIKEAEKSKQEMGKPPIYVGAVVVKNGKILAKAHHGEICQGEHAEYIVLERKLRGKDISGATLYTTLEPCTKRGPQKVSCCRWILKRRIDRVVIGIYDPNRDISRIGFYILSENGLRVELFPESLQNKITKLNQKFFEEQIRYRESRESAIVKIKEVELPLENSENLFQFLKWKYKDEPILERCDKTYPVIVYPAPMSQMQSPDSVLLGRLDINIPNYNNLSSNHTEFRNLLTQAGRPLNDRLTYTMKELNVEGILGLKCELGSYFRTLDTCLSLEWEILRNAKALKNGDIAAFKQFDKLLSLRFDLHNRVENPVRNGLYRSAAIGISTLIAYNDGGSYYLWIRRRSSSGVAIHTKLNHVIPSFMFQPVISEALNEEFSVTHNIYREYLEEIFNRPEPAEEQYDCKYFHCDPCYQHLQSLIGTKEAKLYLSGIAVDLLSLKPEICTVLLIESENWHKYHAKHPSPNQRFYLNEEWATSNDSKDNLKTLVARVPYKTTDEELMKEASLQPTQMTPSGAAAFWLGIDILRKVLRTS